MQLGLLLLPREVPEKVLGHYTLFPAPGCGPWGSIYSPAVFLTAVQSVASKTHQAHSLLVGKSVPWPEKFGNIMTGSLGVTSVCAKQTITDDSGSCIEHQGS